MFDEPNILETVLSAAYLVAGISAAELSPALIPLGVLVALGGAGGLIFGHW
ncbi:MAG: hypothetical protein LIO70_01280 [Clostridiales bacterium]|nr:hypothetical protein [Clostridiales bacterium]